MPGLIELAAVLAVILILFPSRLFVMARSLGETFGLLHRGMERIIEDD